MKWRPIRNRWNLKAAPWFGGAGIEEGDEQAAVPALVCWLYRGRDADAEVARICRLHNEEEDRRDEGAKAVSQSALRDENAALKATLRSFVSFTHGLCCLGCKAQGRELDAKCCKDSDCDAGWYGVDAGAILDLLEAAEKLAPGMLAEIEKPEIEVNEFTVGSGHGNDR